MNPLASSKCAGRVLMALAAISGILLIAGCGSGSPVIVKGGFSNASLKGTYSFTVKGYGLNSGTSATANFFIEGGVLTADGNGNVTAATEDRVEAVGSTTQVFQPAQATGTYSIKKDGTGDLQFIFGGGAEQFRITLSDTGHLYLEEDDGFGTSAGSAYLQTSTTTPSGPFVFRTHDVFVSATMGTMAISAGDVSGSFVMVQNGGAATGINGAGGSITAPTGGRGTITYSVNGLTHTAEYYVVSTSTFLLLAESPNIHAFGSSGETATGFINTVGVFTADGSSNIAETYDSVQDGTVSTNATAAWTYAINSDGSGSFSLGSVAQREIWMVSPTRVYFIALNGANVEDGTIDQQSGTFSNTSLATQAAFFMDGFDGVNVLLKDRVGTLVPSGTDSLGTNYVTSFFDPNALAGGANSNAFSGTYSVAGNGRTTTQLNGFTNNIILYLTTNSTGYMLQADSGVNMSGAFTAQPSQ